jgi:hypothetical protein
MFVNVQPLEASAPPQLVNVAHIVKLTGDVLKLSDGSIVRLHAETVLRLHATLPKLVEGGE